MRQLFYVHGLKRSGNHAIISWLNAHGRFVLCNDCIPITPILAGRKTIPPPEDFNTWFTDPNYRKSLSQDLQLKFTDQGFSRVAHNGGGSSFDGQNFDGDNSRMDVLNRKNHLSDTEKHLLDNILEDAELQDLNHRISAMNHREDR